VCGQGSSNGEVAEGTIAKNGIRRGAGGCGWCGWGCGARNQHKAQNTVYWAGVLLMVAERGKEVGGLELPEKQLRFVILERGTIHLGTSNSSTLLFQKGLRLEEEGRQR